MKNIIDELEERDAVMCMRCGSIFEGASEEDYWADDCPACGKSLLNWVTGDMHETFWGSAAAKGIAKEFEER